MGKAKMTVVLVPCQRCNAGGIPNPKYQEKTCPVCGGKGYVMVKAK